MGDYSSQDPSDVKRIDIKIPTKLIERIHGYCRKHNITVDNFILDAVTSKLQLANQERRKRQRL